MDYWYTNILQINTFKHLIYANYLKTESIPHKKINLVRMSVELMTLALLAPRSANWANGPLIQVYAKYIVFEQWMYANYLKIESYHTKREIWSLWVSNSWP